MTDDEQQDQHRQKGKAEVEKNARALETLAIEYMPTSEIRANTYNPNRQSEHDFNLLKKSMVEDGFTQPVVAIRITQEMVDAGEDEGHPLGSTVIVDGEHRWRAAHDLGLEQIPVVIVPMNLVQARVATLRHNRARGSEDVELAAEVLRDLEKLGALDWAQDSLELDQVEVDRLLADIPAPEALAAPEFSGAWEPGNADAENTDGAKGTQSATPAAIQAARDAETAAQDARTGEDRQAARREAAVERFTFTFGGDEGRVVRRVLGSENPAQRLLELCEANDPGEAAAAAQEPQEAPQEASEPEAPEATVTPIRPDAGDEVLAEPPEPAAPARQRPPDFNPDEVLPEPPEDPVGMSVPPIPDPLDGAFD